MISASQLIRSAGMAALFVALTSSATAQCPSDWTLAASTGPTARNYVGLAYDSTRDITILYGGTSGGINGEKTISPWWMTAE